MSGWLLIASGGWLSAGIAWFYEPGTLLRSVRLRRALGLCCLAAGFGLLWAAVGLLLSAGIGLGLLMLCGAACTLLGGYSKNWVRATSVLGPLLGVLGALAWLWP